MTRVWNAWHRPSQVVCGMSGDLFHTARFSTLRLLMLLCSPFHPIHGPSHPPCVRGRGKNRNFAAPTSRRGRWTCATGAANSRAARSAPASACRGNGRASAGPTVLRRWWTSSATSALIPGVATQPATRETERAPSSAVSRSARLSAVAKGADAPYVSGFFFREKAGLGDDDEVIDPTASLVCSLARLVALHNNLTIPGGGGV